MLLKNIVYDLVQTRNYKTIKEMVGNEEDYKMLLNFMRRLNSDTAHRKQISYVRRVAQILNVPVEFIINVIELGGIEDEGFKTKYIRFDRGL